MTPTTNSPPDSQLRTKIVAAIVILLLLLLGGCWFLHRKPQAKVVAKEPAPSRPAPTTTDAAAPPAGALPPPTPPNYETWFINSVRQYQTGVPAESDQDRLAYNRGERRRGISNALPGIRKLAGWVGTLHKVQKLPGGKAAIAIELPATTILLQTWGDTTADAGAGTLLDQSSAIYHSLASIKEGTPVTFDGEFLEDKDDWCKEGSKTVREGFLAPKYIVHFTDVKAAGK